MRKSNKRIPVWCKILLGILIFLTIIIIAGVIFVYNKLGKINHMIEIETLPVEEEFFEIDETAEADKDMIQLAPEDVTWSDTVEVKGEDDIVNILLIGQDRRPGESRARSDTMIIASVNKTDKTITLISLMRDMYVQIPGYSDNRINAAYAFGGMKLLDETIKQNVDIEIDGASAAAGKKGAGGVRNIKSPKNFDRYVDPHPFVPSNQEKRTQRCLEVITLQAQGLAKRLRHINCQSAVIGLSGGLDSTLALLITCRAFDSVGIARSKITAITMPCFGTTDRTYNNACTLAKECGATLKEIRIADSVRQHFKDIGQDESVHDVTYENGQARERTQILMDYANKTNGIVIGTGDLSELALGWCTYNGDHMSMYGVNSSIPKTLVRYLVEWFATASEDSKNIKFADVLKDILDTPVSPELLPPKDGVISQVTEDLVGPYELHDFYLYYLLRFGFSPAKIFFLAQQSKLPYSKEVMLKWLKTFYRRFFSQQFKRSCMPDGAKVGTINLSPRGDWRMPSDASAAMWLEEVEALSL